MFTSLLRHRILEAPLFFALIGPVIGMLPLVGAGSGDLFIIVMAYAIGAKPAAVAGLVYGAAATIFQWATSTKNIGAVLAASFGGLAGLVGIMSLNVSTTGRATAESNGAAGLQAISVVAGAICGVLFAMYEAAPRSQRNARQESVAMRLRRTAAISSQGTLLGEHGLCPNCNAVISIASVVCIGCQATFAEGATWGPVRLSHKDRETYNQILRFNTSPNTSEPDA